MQSKLTTLLTLALLTLGIAGSAQAQPADYRTYFTFSAPVTLPGVTLPAGKYIFRLADPNSSRKVINVMSADGKKSLAMLHTIPNQAPKAPQDPEIRFMETSSNVAPPIKTWWYPGKAIGYEFIYPRKQALELAKVTSQPVLTTAKDTNDLETEDLSRINGDGVPAEVKADPNPAPVAAVGRAQQGQVDGGSSAVSAAPQDTRADERARATTRTELPRTASPVPAILLFGIGVGLLGVGLALGPRTRS